MKRRMLFSKSIILTMLIIATMICASVVVNAEDDNLIASGNDGGIIWQVDKSGCLTITGEGEQVTFDTDDEGITILPWSEYTEEITRAVVDVKGMKSTEYLFYNCRNLVSVDLSRLNTSEITNMNSMFSSCRSLEEIDFSNWDTSSVTDMGWMFEGCSELTSLNISDWNTESLEMMGSMFSGCEKLSDIDVSNWDTHAVTDMSFAFGYCQALTEIDLSKWNTSNVTDFSYMFNYCENLKKLDLSNWDTHSAMNLSAMFSDCSELKELNVNGWDTGAVGTDDSYDDQDEEVWRDMDDMFTGCTKLLSLDLSDWDTANVRSMRELFDNCKSLREIIVPASFGIKVNHEITLPGVGWKIKDGDTVTCIDKNIGAKTTYVKSREASGKDGGITWNIDADGRLTVTGDGSYTEVLGHKSEDEDGYLANNYPQWHDYAGNITSAVVNVTGLKSTANFFADCEFLETADLKGLDTSAVKDMSNMFGMCESLKAVDVSNWNTSKVTDMSLMFDTCKSLTSVDVGNWNVKSVEDISAMFYGCENLSDLDVSKWNTRNMYSIMNAFNGCTSLKNIDVSKWDTGSVTMMNGVFQFCESLSTLDVSNWDTSKVEEMPYLFDGCTSLTSLDVSKWDTSAVGVFEDDTETSEDGEYTTTIRVGDYGMDGMFKDCTNLVQLDLSGWDTSKNEYMDEMFQGCESLQKLIIPANFGNKARTDIELPGDGWKIKGGDAVTCIVKNLDSAKTYIKGDEPEVCTEHAWDEGKVTTEPTCTEKGVKTYTCANCGETKTEEIAAAGHKAEAVAAKAATCTDTGYEAYWKCSVCGNLFSDEACTKPIEKPVETVALGHKWDDGKVTTEPTCTEKGVKTYTCSNCGETKTEEIAAVGHEYGDWTFDADSKTHVKTCKNDASHKVAENCTFDEGVVTTEPTTENEGVKTFTCSVCKGSYTESIDKLDPDPDPEPAKSDVVRIFGSTRYETSIKTAKALKEIQGGDKFDCIIVATGENFADSLAGSYLSAANHNAPIVAIPTKLKNANDKAALDTAIEFVNENIKPNGKVYILGGELAISKNVQSRLGKNVKRLAGASRYKTNITILEEAGLDKADELIVSTGNNFADSLSAASAGKPILLVDKTMNADQKAFISKYFRGKKITVLGGEFAVSNAVMAELKKVSPSVERVAGSSRYDTSKRIAERYFGKADSAVLVYGQNFPDGLSGGPLANELGTPLLLVNDAGTDTIAAYTANTEMKGGYALGGPKFVTDASVKKILKCEEIKIYE